MFKMSTRFPGMSSELAQNASNTSEYYATLSPLTPHSATIPFIGIVKLHDTNADVVIHHEDSFALQPHNGLELHFKS